MDCSNFGVKFIIHSFLNWENKFLWHVLFPQNLFLSDMQMDLSGTLFRKDKINSDSLRVKSQLQKTYDLRYNLHY